MNEFNKKEIVTPEKTKLTYDDKVLIKIAGLATEEVQGVITASSGFIGNITDRFKSEDTIKGVDVEVGEKQVALDLNVFCEYGRNIPDIFNRVQEKVGDAIKRMTGLELVELNMNVEDVLRKDEMDEVRKHQNTTPMDALNRDKDK